MNMSTILWMLALAAIVYIAYRFSDPSRGLVGGQIPVSNVISHWSHFFQSFAMSSNEFYGELEKTLQGHEMPNSSIQRTRHKEGGMLSAAREYLRIKHGDLVFDVCAAPFGKDFFISWWLYETTGAMRVIFKGTRFGSFLQQRASKRTFYQIDEEDMFRSCVHECILEAVAKMTEGKGEWKLTDADKTFKMGGL